MRLRNPDFTQACNCAVAYAVAVLLEPGGLTSKLAWSVLSPRWFTEGIRWAQMVVEGWGAMFGFFAQELAGRTLPLSADLEALTLESASHSMALESLLDNVQKYARAHAVAAEENEGGFPAFIASVRASGAWQVIWRGIEDDLKSRTVGRKCAVVMTGDGELEWTACSPWVYNRTSDFSSPLEVESAGGLGHSDVAVCALGAPRAAIDTYAYLRVNVVEALQGDAFVYVPYPREFTAALERQLKRIGPAVTLIAALDVDGSGMEARLISELEDKRFLDQYREVPGPWRAPVFGQMGSSMWGYHMQYACRRMVEAHEVKRGGRLYHWVVLARADMFWVHKHPPLDIMDRRYVYIPYGQDNSHYAHGPLMGINDRHAVVPRPLFRKYFGRWQELGTGDAWKYLQQVAGQPHPVNTEQYLLLHLRAHHVPILRFPPVSFLAHCTEGPQCQHLYKATNLRKQGWSSMAKYWTEMIEVRRTIMDDLHWTLRRGESGWIWAQLRPAAVPVPVSWMSSHRTEKAELGVPDQRFQPWEIQGLDFVCCLSQSGPVTCYHWAFLRRCVSLASRPAPRLQRAT